MSKNIIIQEGGTGKQMTVSKLKTDKVGGGACLWVPEEEVSLSTKHITENGTYTASEDGKYGYSQVIVNIPGGAGSASSSGTPTTSGGTTPGGIGSAVVGTDPTDGNEYGVGVDENGNLVSTKVPSNIAVSKEPDKVDYTISETIDYSGIIVTLKGGDGEPFSNSDYPNGRIPFSELEFPISTAEISEDANSYSDGVGVNATLVHCETPVTLWGYRQYRSEALGGDDQFIATGTATDVFLTKYNNHLYLRPKEGSAVVNSCYLQHGNYGGFESAADENNYIVSGFAWGKINGDIGNLFSVIAQSSSNPLNSIGELVLDKQTLPVKWNSPYDGRTFTTHFTINVTSASEGEDNEGGGGGHSF